MADEDEQGQEDHRQDRPPGRSTQDQDAARKHGVGPFSVNIGPVCLGVSYYLGSLIFGNSPMDEFTSTWGFLKRSAMRGRLEVVGVACAEGRRFETALLSILGSEYIYIYTYICASIYIYIYIYTYLYIH